MNYYAEQIQAAHGAEIAAMKSECERMRKLAEKNEAAADALWAQRDRLLIWMREISDMDPRKLDTGYYAVNRAKSALKEVGDDR